MERVRRASIVLVALLVGVALSTPGIAAEKTFKLRGQSCFGLSTPLGQNTIVIWKNLVEKMSGGRIQVQLFDAGEIVPPNKVYDAVGTDCSTSA